MLARRLITIPVFIGTTLLMTALLLSICPYVLRQPTDAPPLDTSTPVAA